MYACESWTIKKAEHQKIGAFELWCWSRLLRVSWTARRSNQSILKEISPEYSLEGLMLKLKLQYLATWCEELTHQKRPWCWERWKAAREGDNRGWDGWITSLTRWYEFEEALGISGGQGSLACCSPRGPKSQTWLSNWTYWLYFCGNNKEKILFPIYQCNQERLFFEKVVYWEV